jgi:peroxiredoxin Q/BCP
MSNKIGEGDLAPEFNLPTDNGGTLSLSDLKGHPTVLYFYPKDDTSGCTKQAIAFSEFKSAFDEINVPVIGISADSPKKHDAFKAKHNLTIQLASNEDKSVLEAYGVWIEKSMYGRKYMGIERTTFLLYANGRIMNVWRKVKVPGHVEQVLESARKI